MSLAKRHYAIWVFTAACPSRCVYCDLESQKRKSGLTVAEVERVAGELVAAGFSEVIFAGGEALLSPHFPAALRALGGRVRTAVFTGGLPGFVDRAIDVLREGRVDRLVYSIDSGRSGRNDLIRGRAGITQDLLELAASVQQRLPRVSRSVNTVVSKHNIDSLGDVWDRMSPFGLDSWALTVAGDVFEGNAQRSLPTAQQLADFYFGSVPALAAKLARDRAELVVLPVPYPFLVARVPPALWGKADERMRGAVAAELELFARGEHNATFVRRHGCPLVGIDVIIGVGGEVHPCSQAPIIRPEYVMGNLKTQSLNEILSGDALRAFRAGVPHASCTRCWAPSNVPRELLHQLLLARGDAGAA